MDLIHLLIVVLILVALVYAWSMQRSKKLGNAEYFDDYDSDSENDEIM